MKNLSIIIPHYNSSRKLKRLLNSIPYNDDIEVIVIDDRSTDDLNELDLIISNYGNKNVMFHNNDKEAKGAGTCRNIGLDMAKGKWLLFADSDDYFLEGFYNILTNYFNLESDIVYFAPTSWDEEKSQISDRHITIFKCIDKFDIENKKTVLDLKFNNHGPCSKLIKREFVNTKNIKFDEIIVSNDTMFSIKTSYFSNKIIVSKEVIYCITKSRGTLTQNISKSMFRIRLDTNIRKYVFLRSALSKDDFISLELRFVFFLINVFKYNLGFDEYLRTYKLIKKNNINLITKSLLNPLTIISKIFYHIKDKFNSRKLKVK